MSEPSNGAWPFQEIPEEEGLDISAIFGDSSAAPQGDPFAPPAAAQSVPSSPTPVAQEITPAVAATSQPTTAPIAKAPVEAPAENPIAAAFEQKTAENTKKGLLEKPPVFYHKGVKEEIDDPSMTFEELRMIRSSGGLLKTCELLLLLKPKLRKPLKYFHKDENSNPNRDCLSEN
mgnify:CR=1 FL=1